MFNRNNAIGVLFRSFFYCWVVLLSFSYFNLAYLKADTERQEPESKTESEKKTSGSKTSPPLAGIKATFIAQDTDEDGQLSRAEFLNSFPEKQLPGARRDFQLFNRDGNEHLSFEEYSAIPGMAPGALRGSLSNPLSQLVDKLMETVDQGWERWDQDADGQLSQKEFEAARIGRKIPGLALSSWQDWDRDADGNISKDDCRWLFEAGYGIRRLDGQLLHLPTGQVVYWWHFKELDRNHDDLLTLKEFQGYYNRFGEKEAKQRFQNCDADKNQRITLSEWANISSYLTDPIAKFRNLDQNLDAQVSPEELLKGTAPFLRPLAQYIFPGFDRDRNGTLSLDEYRLTMVANRVENWDVTSRDTDHDGRLSLEEMAWTPGLELSLLRQEYFQRLDLNQNGFLELDEFKVSIDGSKVSGEIALKAGFYSRDTNRDRQVTKEEFVASFSQEKQPVAKRDFHLFNRDGNEILSFKEYRMIPGLIPVALRQGLPHPLQTQIEQWMSLIEEHWQQWDKDDNNSLSSEEFKSAKLEDQISGLPQSTLKDWDRNTDGAISLNECRHVLEATYGLKRLDGQQLYLPSGRIVYWWHFKDLDRDHDDSLTLKEFMAYYKRLGEEAGIKRFTDGDADQDGKITLAEWAEIPGNLLDPIAEFRKMDVNYDALLDPDELAEQTAKWLLPVARYTFPQFDLDQNGKLSLDEYRMTMPANRVENWLASAQDQNNDGKLSLSELPWTPGLELSLLRKEYFDRLDSNNNGFLELNEYEFSIDVNKVPPQMVLKAGFQKRDADQDGVLNLTEFISKIPADKLPEARRDFQLFDRDLNQSLSYEEYLTIPGIAPSALRGSLSHPLTKSVNELMETIDEGWDSWDRDQDDELSLEEFHATKIHEQIAGLPPALLKEWDLDNNGKVNRDEYHAVLEAAYGLRRLDGQPLELPTGQVVYWWHFKELDRDHDDSLTLKEFQNYYNRFGEKEAKQRFKKGDMNQDETLSLKEWAAMPGFLLDPVSEFRKYDTNYDGKLSQQELIDGIAPFLKPLAKTVFPGFDLDGDEFLSLDEYRITMVANRIENWMISARDQNYDGKLSLSELPWTPGLELSLLRKEYFDRLDQNQDGFLELNECEFSIDVNKVPPQMVLKAGFQKRDSDRDRTLNQSEFTAAFPDEKQPEARRDFQLFDQDADQKLSIDEYAAVPGMAPAQLRGPLSNPLVNLVDRLMEKLDQNWNQWDKDQDEMLSPAEFQSAKPGRQVPGLTLSSWEDWDRDADGKISKDDCRWLFEAGYGIRRLDGQMLHLPTGQVVYWWHFKELDRDHDDSLTLKEFMAYYKRLGEEAGKKRFTDGDADQDGKITLAEWAETPGNLLDPIAEFRKMDVNYDALLDPDELAEQTAKWLLPVARYTFPQFDLDQNGKLSLDEYRMTMPANRVENWLASAQDQNNDGKLSLSEMPWSSGLELSLLRKEYYDRLDSDNNGFLELNEYEFSIDVNKVPPQMVLKAGFQKRDADQDGTLNQSEFTSAFPEEKQPVARRDFQLFDRDLDQKLSIDEYAAVPGMAPGALRGSLSNPLSQLVDKLMETVDQGWERWDQDADGQLSQKEFEAARIGRKIPGLALSSWQDWDRDADGKISKDDCRWLFEAGYGIRRLDGQLLHLPTGQVVYWWHFKELDRNHDDLLTLKEFMVYYKRLGEEAGKKRFTDGDADQDGKITLAEWAETPGNLLDPIAEFRKMDLNLDATLDETELMEGIAPFLRPLASYTFPGFDLNQDGVLSLDEYRTSLPTNRVENWIVYSRDTDKDGRVTLTELGWSSGLELNLLRQEYFDRLDINRNGYLDFNEFKFTADMSKVPKELYFEHCDEDQDGSLTLDEFLNAEKNSGKIKLDGSPEPRVMRIEEAFYRADVNGDKQISLAELDTEAGHQIIAPNMSFKTGNRSSLQVSKQDETAEDDSNMMLVVLGLNVALVLGVIVFLFRSHFKKV